MAETECITRVCTMCFEVKPATQEFFSPRTVGKLKLASRCKLCQAKWTRENRKTDENARKRHLVAVTKSIKKRMAVDPVFFKKVKDGVRERKRKMRADPKRNEKLLERNREWRKANWDRVKKYKHKCGALAVFHVTMRYAAKLKATPKWADVGAIQKFYEEARRMTLESGIEHQVDHIVPLQSKKVCGLHVQSNLQVLLALVNKRKSNKLIEGAYYG